MKTKRAIFATRNIRTVLVNAVVFSSLALADSAFAQGPVRITLEQAIEMALRHNHTLQAARTMSAII